MREFDIAQRLARLEDTETACKAYKMALEKSVGEDPTIEMEAAAYILQFGSGDDYKISYTCFCSLYNRGCYQKEIKEIMDEAFYEPNIREIRTHYRRNCKLLQSYPYIFRNDFPQFSKLPIRFYPYAENSYTPYYGEEKRFGEYIDFRKEVVSRNFFKDLENPILAKDVYSQYELEYLNDNVRKSEYIGRENHIYLHYSDWETFCSYLCCLNLRPLLESQKFVFLFGDEISQYPIDFKERFGIDYSQYPIKPLDIREINRMIWHTQLSAHNGGDFFNEVFDDHPNLLVKPSIMLESLEEASDTVERILSSVKSNREAQYEFEDWNNPRLVNELYHMRNRSPKDIMVALFLRDMEETSPHLDKGARIVPALFFQPHFYNIEYSLDLDDKGRAVLTSASYDRICTSPLFRKFKYIKTFTPLRRMTTSHGASVKFMYNQTLEEVKEGETRPLINDAIMVKVLNRSFMIDWQDRLFKDSVLVRFEDGKLNPKATFTALAAFLDLPYTESFTYCSEHGELDPESYAGNARGFDPVTVYRTYDDFTNDLERAYLEYFMRDVYKYYGYETQYLEGESPESKKAEDWVEGFTTIDKYMRGSWIHYFENLAESDLVQSTDETSEEKPVKEIAEEMLNDYMAKVSRHRVEVTAILQEGLRFVNKNGQPLRMMPKLELDPTLLEQPLYH